MPSFDSTTTFPQPALAIPANALKSNTDNMETIIFLIFIIIPLLLICVKKTYFKEKIKPDSTKGRFYDLIFVPSGS